MPYTLLDTWTNVCLRLFPNQDSGLVVHPVHACVIGGIKHFIHAPELSRKDPFFFKQLKDYAHTNGAHLLADRRSNEQINKTCRRKHLLPILFLSFTMTGKPVHAENLDITFGLIEPARPTLESSTPYQPSIPNNENISASRIEAKEIKKILLSHLEIDRKKRNVAVEQSIQHMSIYYAQYPEVVSLIKALGDRDWTLRFAPHTFQTSVSGTRLSVDKVTVYFDHRSAAQLKFYDSCNQKKPFCIASPADALLHELIHVYTITRNIKAFIAQGGLSQHLYPAKHERETIKKENDLYKSMTKIDRKPRPIRNEHTGRHVLVSCVTCVQ